MILEAYTSVQAEEVWDLSGEGVSPGRIAKRLGLSEATVRHIRREGYRAERAEEARSSERETLADRIERALSRPPWYKTDGVMIGSKDEKGEVRFSGTNAIPNTLHPKDPKGSVRRANTGPDGMFIEGLLDCISGG